MDWELKGNPLAERRQPFPEHSPFPWNPGFQT